MRSAPHSKRKWQGRNPHGSPLCREEKGITDTARGDSALVLPALEALYDQRRDITPLLRYRPRIGYAYTFVWRNISRRMGGITGSFPSISSKLSENEKRKQKSPLVPDFVHRAGLGYSNERTSISVTSE